MCMRSLFALRSPEIAVAVENQVRQLLLPPRMKTARRVRLAKKKIDKFDLYVDVQGDEPFIDPNHISEVIQCHRKYKPDHSLTITANFESKPSHVKAVVDINGRIMYLSRSDIPFKYKQQTFYLKHLSIVKSNLRIREVCPIADVTDDMVTW